MNPRSSHAFSFPYRHASVLTFLLCLALGAIILGCGGEIPPAPTQEGDPLDGERINSYYTNDEIRYFLEVAVGDTSDGSGSGKVPRTMKWLDNIRITLEGQPTPEDSTMVRQVAYELNRVLYEIDIAIVDENPNVRMYFVPPDEFHLVEPAIEPGSDYLFLFYTAPSLSITDATILIPVDTAEEQFERDPTILRSMVGILGFLNRSLKYPESVFHSWWNWATELAPIDRKVIEMLYQPEIRPGMTREEVIAVMTNR